MAATLSERGLRLVGCREAQSPVQALGSSALGVNLQTISRVRLTPAMKSSRGGFPVAAGHSGMNPSQLRCSDRFGFVSNKKSKPELRSRATLAEVSLVQRGGQSNSLELAAVTTRAEISSWRADDSIVEQEPCTRAPGDGVLRREVLASSLGALPWLAILSLGTFSAEAATETVAEGGAPPSLSTVPPSSGAISTNPVAKQSAIREALWASATPAKCPGLLRLAFHDAGTYDVASGTGGMNGSVIYELDRKESDGLKRYVKLIGKVKEDLAAQGVEASWADLIAVGGAVAVEMCGGPHIPVRVGRLDSGQADVAGRMPAETFDAEQVVESFKGKGYSLQETVALLGGHTLGSKGFGDATKFDNSYYAILLQKPWKDPANKMASMIGLPSDKAIADSEDASELIQLYAAEEEHFFQDFVVAYQKMVDSGASWEA